MNIPNLNHLSVVCWEMSECVYLTSFPRRIAESWAGRGLVLTRSTSELLGATVLLTVQWSRRVLVSSHP